MLIYHDYFFQIMFFCVCVCVWNSSSFKSEPPLIIKQMKQHDPKFLSGVTEVLSYLSSEVDRHGWLLCVNKKMVLCHVSTSGDILFYYFSNKEAIFKCFITLSQHTGYFEIKAASLARHWCHFKKTKRQRLCVCASSTRQRDSLKLSMFVRSNGTPEHNTEWA